MKRIVLATLLAATGAAPAAAATVAVGYTYEVSGGGGAAFATVTAPTFAAVPDADGYDLTVGATTVALAGGVVLDFLATFGETPMSFTISGIDPALALNPADDGAFLTGVSLTGFDTGVAVSISQTPITAETTPVPLPASILFLGAGLGALGAMKRARSRVAARPGAVATV
jgi:hypothetical protein